MTSSPGLFHNWLNGLHHSRAYRAVASSDNAGNSRDRGKINPSLHEIHPQRVHDARDGTVLDRYVKSINGQAHNNNNNDKARSTTILRSESARWSRFSRSSPTPRSAISLIFPRTDRDDRHEVDRRAVKRNRQARCLETRRFRTAFSIASNVLLRATATAKSPSLRNVEGPVSPWACERV